MNKQIVPITSFRIGNPLFLMRQNALTLAELIKRGHYSFTEPLLQRLNGSPCLNMHKDRAVELISFDGKFPTVQVLAHLNMPGGHAASLEDGLCLGEQYPFLQRGWFATRQGDGNRLFRMVPEDAPVTVHTQNYWCPKIVCLGTRLQTNVNDYDHAAALTYNCPFGRGRNLVTVAFERDWVGDGHCFVRVLD